MTWDQVDATVLKQLYYEENLPDSLIAERFGVSKREVTKKRRQYDIGLRQRSSFCRCSTKRSASFTINCPGSVCSARNASTPWQRRSLTSPSAWGQWRICTLPVSCLRRI